MFLLGQFEILRDLGEETTKSMMPRHRPLNVAYAAYMQNHPFGTALYTPQPAQDFHPGSCGYFDLTGSWNPITDLSDPDLLASQGFSPVQEELQHAPAETDIQWGPLASENVESSGLDFSAGVSPALAAAIPANLSAQLSFSNSTAGGALLLTASPVVRQRFYHESQFKKWVIANAERLVQHRSEIFEYGLCVITSTWATKDCAIHIWDEAGKEVKVGFDVGVDAIGKLGPGLGWSINSKDSGWMRYKASKADHGLVVFFNGLRFRSRKFPIFRREILIPSSRTANYALEYSETKTMAQSAEPMAMAQSAETERMAQSTETKTMARVPVPDEDAVWEIESEPMQLPGQMEALLEE